MPPLIKYLNEVILDSFIQLPREQFSCMESCSDKLHVYGLPYYEKEFLHTRFHSYLIKLLSENIVCGRLLLNVVIKIFTFASVAVSSGSKVCLL